MSDSRERAIFKALGGNVFGEEGDEPARSSPKAEDKDALMSESVLKQELLELAGMLRDLNGRGVILHSSEVKLLLDHLDESAALREEIARLTLLSDSQLANQERLTTLEEIREASGDHMEASESERDNFHIHAGKLYILESVAAKAVMRGEERLQKMEQMRQESGGMLSRVAVASGRQDNLKQRAEKAEAQLATERANQERLVGEMQELREAARAFVAKLNQVEPVINGMIGLQFARTGQQYRGPNYVEEKTALVALLAKEAPTDEGDK